MRVCRYACFPGFLKRLCGTVQWTLFAAAAAAMFALSVVGDFSCRVVTFCKKIFTCNVGDSCTIIAIVLRCHWCDATLGCYYYDYPYMSDDSFVFISFSPTNWALLYKVECST